MKSLRSPFAIALLSVSMMVAAGIQAEAQSLQRVIAPFSILEGGDEPLLNPFAGGLDLARIGLIDIDGDSYRDLLVLNLGEPLRVYRNVDGKHFELIESNWTQAPVRSWFRIVDVNNDGTHDLLTSGELSEVLLYENIGTDAAPQFAPRDTVRQAGGDLVYTEQQTVPTLVDIDADEDLDLFSGNVDGTITYFENVGTPGQHEFEFRTARYEGILVLSPAKAEKDGRTTESRLHGASVLDFVDLDDDDDLDILFGDFFTKKLLLFENRGTPTAADFDTAWVDTAFGPTGDIVSSNGFNQAVSADLDLDDDVDVIVSSLLPSAFDRPIELYENLGTAQAPELRRVDGNPTAEIDVGRRAVPTRLIDDERDGMIVGAEDGSLSWFSFDRTDGDLKWELQRRYVLPGLSLAVPSAADINDDGRAEIVVGKASGIDGTTLRLYRFEGDAIERMPWQLDTSFNVVRSNAAPVFEDIDGDGDFDLFIGGKNGRFEMFLNVGTRSNPTFELTSPPVPFDTIDLDGSTVPHFTDLDGDGDRDVVVGIGGEASLAEDSLRFWIRDGERFKSDVMWPTIAVARYPAPAGFVLDDRAWLFAGTQAGGLVAYRNNKYSSDVPVVVEPDTTGGPGRTLVIPPGTETLSLELSTSGKSPGKLGVFDLRGTSRQLVATPIDRNRVNVSVDDLPAGFYVWRAEDGNTGSILVLR